MTNVIQMSRKPAGDKARPEKAPAPHTKIADAYIRSTDGARMVAIEPGSYVNEAVWKILGAIH